MDRFEVPLTEELREHIEVRVGENGFPDTGTYIKALIERDLSDIEELREEIRRGDESGLSSRTVDEILDEAFRKYGASRA